MPIHVHCLIGGQSVLLFFRAFSPVESYLVLTKGSWFRAHSSVFVDSSPSYGSNSYTIRAELSDGSTEDDVIIRCECTHPTAVIFNLGLPRPASERTAMSRGVWEGMTDFIRNAGEIRVVMYEMDFEPFLEELMRIKRRGSRVTLVFSDRVPGNTEMVRRMDGQFLRDNVVFRNKSPCLHHKFMIRTEKSTGVKSVWTASLNATKGGIFGQSNMCVTLNDPATVAAYEQQFDMLVQDIPAKVMRNFNEQNSPVPVYEELLPGSFHVVFSPRKSLELLSTICDIIVRAQNIVCITSAFGLHPMIRASLLMSQAKQIFILSDKPLSCEVENEFEQNRRIRIAFGNHLPHGLVDDEGHEIFEAENLTGWNDHVKYIHLKTLVVDPVTNPICVFGSGNFSEASCIKNDEDVVFHRGESGGHDNYTTSIFIEFIRLWKQYYVRARHSGKRVYYVPAHVSFPSGCLTVDEFKAFESEFVGPVYVIPRGGVMTWTRISNSSLAVKFKLGVFSPDNVDELDRLFSSNYGFKCRWVKNHQNWILQISDDLFSRLAAFAYERGIQIKRIELRRWFGKLGARDSFMEEYSGPGNLLPIT